MEQRRPGGRVDDLSRPPERVGGRDDGRTLAAGAARNTSANVFRWLRNPASIKPESHMPNFQLSDDNANALAAYLETLE